ncbi:MAG: hypothetical protein ACTSVB_08535 [Candidatus Heimdallarchaeaceae archaeon]
MLDGVRVRTFTLFGTITSIAAALHYWAPDIYVPLLCNLFIIRLSALVELTTFFVIIACLIQNRLYHYWLFKAINISLYYEKLILQKLEERGLKLETILTRALTGLEERNGSYWKAMKRSKLFWTEIAIFFFMSVASIVLFYAFQAPTTKIEKLSLTTTSVI